MTTENLNPNYCYYAKAHGRTTTEMRAYDEERYPGGRMVGFMLWISKAKQTARTEAPECLWDPKDSFSPVADLKLWDAYLSRCTHTVE